MQRGYFVVDKIHYGFSNEEVSAECGGNPAVLYRV